MKRIFVLLSVFTLILCLSVSAFASNGTGTRTGDVVGGGSVETQSQGWHGGNGNGNGNNGGSGSGGGFDILNPGSSQDYINNEIFGNNGLISSNVTTETIQGKLESKGNDIVSILQTVGKYVCIAGFIVCCILTLIGIIGNKRLLAGAIIGLLISGLAYAGIVCGREIVNWIAAWAVS